MIGAASRLGNFDRNDTQDAVNIKEKRGSLLLASTDTMRSKTAKKVCDVVLWCGNSLKFLSVCSILAVQIAEKSRKIGIFVLSSVGKELIYASRKRNNFPRIHPG